MSSLHALTTRIEQIKRELAALGPLRPGTLSEQFNICGKPGCGCKADPPRKHGPYHQLSFTWRGRSSSLFVRRDDLDTVEEQIRNYRKLRELVDDWISLGMQMAELQLKDRRSKPVKRTRRRRAPSA